MDLFPEQLDTLWLVVVLFLIPVDLDETVSRVEKMIKPMIDVGAKIVVDESFGVKLNQLSIARGV